LCLGKILTSVGIFLDFTVFVWGVRYVFRLKDFLKQQEKSWDTFASQFKKDRKEQVSILCVLSIALILEIAGVWL
jgi:hypothetical protein